MTCDKKIALGTILVLLGGCDINYATFVTASHIGIKADTKTEQVGIGIGRTELFLGPGYPVKGTAPSAFGYLQTNTQIFAPEVTQLYATGAAADAVTQSTPPSPPDATTANDLSGVRRPLVFGTNTDIGLKLGFVANAPSSINFGYDRQEVSIIPLEPTLAQGGKDIYAPVLAAVSLNVKVSDPSNSGLNLGQFFATGNAALNLAGSTEIRTLYRTAAAGQIQTSAIAASYSHTTLSDQIERFWKPNGVVNSTNEGILVTCMGQSNAGGKAQIETLIDASSDTVRSSVMSCINNNANNKQ